MFLFSCPFFLLIASFTVFFFFSPRSQKYRATQIRAQISSFFILILMSRCVEGRTALRERKKIMETLLFFSLYLDLRFLKHQCLRTNKKLPMDILDISLELNFYRGIFGGIGRRKVICYFKTVFLLCAFTLNVSKVDLFEPVSFKGPFIEVSIHFLLAPLERN